MKWGSGESSWVEEEDMQCPQLLVEFTKEEERKKKGKTPYALMNTLLDSLNAYLKTMEHTAKWSEVSMKRKILDLVGPGSPILRSTRVRTRLTEQIKSIMSKDELIKVIRLWVENPNQVFAEEWDHPD